MATLKAISPACSFTTKGGKVWKPNAAGLILGADGQAILELVQMGCTLINNQNLEVRLALTTPVVVAATDQLVEINLTTPGATAVSLPAMTAAGSLTVYDGAGNAATNNITVTPTAGTINGASTFVMATNYQSATFTWDGTQWDVT